MLHMLCEIQQSLGQQLHDGQIQQIVNGNVTQTFTKMVVNVYQILNQIKHVIHYQRMLNGFQELEL